MTPLHFWICGSCDVSDEYAPITVLRDPRAQSIVRELNAGPATAVRLAKLLREEESEVFGLLSSLERTGAIAQKGEAYLLVFPLFTSADVRVLKTIATEVAAEIAHRLAETGPALVEIASKVSPAEYIEIDRLLWAVVGCFGLDWGCLERLERLGYLVRHKAQPGGGDYILFGAELSDDFKERFCYSHSDSVGGYVFTTFGDVTGTRDAFPDLLRRVEETVLEDIPSSWNRHLRLALRLYFNELLMDAARVLEALAKESLAREALGRAAGVPEEKVAALLPLLAQLGYLREERGNWQPKVPVFLASDKTPIETSVALVVDLVQPVVETHYNGLRRALHDISPVRNESPSLRSLPKFGISSLPKLTEFWQRATSWRCLHVLGKAVLDSQHG